MRARHTGRNGRQSRFHSFADSECHCRRQLVGIAQRDEVLHRGQFGGDPRPEAETSCFKAESSSSAWLMIQASCSGCRRGLGCSTGGAGHAVVKLEMAVAVPGQRANPCRLGEPHRASSVGNLPCAAVDCGVVGAMNVALTRPRHQPRCRRTDKSGELITDGSAGGIASSLTCVCSLAWSLRCQATHADGRQLPMRHQRCGVTQFQLASNQPLLHCGNHA